MIGYLKGKIVLNDGSAVVIDVSGVGYKVNFKSMIAVGDEIDLFIHTIVKENDISLWGFQTQNELNLFTKLLGVSGVGGRTGQLIVEEHGVSNVVQGVMFKEPEKLRVSGVGKKTAEKIILELEGKLDDIKTDLDPGDGTNIKISGGKMDEVAEGLISLGYTHADVTRALKRLVNENEGIIDQDSQSILKLALKYL